MLDDLGKRCRDHAPIDDHTDTIAGSENAVQVMGNHHHRQREFTLQPYQQLVERRGADRIKTRGRFVEEQQPWVERQRSCQRCALDHAARQLGRILCRSLRRQTDDAHLQHRQFVERAGIELQVLEHRQLHVLQHGERAEQGARLEGHSVASLQLAQARRIELRDVGTVDLHLARLDDVLLVAVVELLRLQRDLQLVDEVLLDLVVEVLDVERLLDLRRSSKEYPLTSEELVALTKHEDFATAQRANRLLRRISPSTAGPILWERMVKLTQRSQVQEVEDEILRLPTSLGIKLLPVDPVEMSLAAKGAWARIVAARVNGQGKTRRVAFKASILPLLKGPANELTEAAWAAVPRLFTEADRAALTEASLGLSERLAPKVKAALDALPAK